MALSKKLYGRSLTPNLWLSLMILAGIILIILLFVLVWGCTFYEYALPALYPPSKWLHFQKSDSTNVFHKPVLLFSGQCIITLDPTCHHHLMFLSHIELILWCKRKGRLIKTRSMKNPHGNLLICKPNQIEVLKVKRA